MRKFLRVALGCAIIFTACNKPEDNPDGLQKMTVTDNQLRFDKTVVDVKTVIGSNPGEKEGEIFYFLDAADADVKYSLCADMCNTSFGHDIDVCRKSANDYALMVSIMDEALSLDCSFGIDNHPNYEAEGEYDYYGYSTLDESSPNLKASRLRIDEVGTNIVLTFNAITTDGHVIQAKVLAVPNSLD